MESHVTFCFVPKFCKYTSFVNTSECWDIFLLYLILWVFDQAQIVFYV